MSESRKIARSTGGKIELFIAPEEAVAGVQGVYTDVWASMGQEDQAAAKAAQMSPYEVTAKLFAAAKPDAK